VHLAKEMAVARRRGHPLSLLIVGLRDFAAVRERFGKEHSEQLLRAFTQQLREATRGADFLVRFGEDQFLAILPGCALGDVTRIARRLEPLAAGPRGEITVELSTGWLDPQPGETPDGPLNRAREMLRLYQEVEALEGVGVASKSR